MWRDFDPREDHRERSDLSRGSRADVRADEQAASTDPREVFTRDLDPVSYTHLTLPTIYSV